MEIKTEGYLQDIAFDFYGEKMAICSTDRLIYIYSKNENEEWTQLGSWDAQDAVFKLQWSHPDFGNILASCGFDKWVIIWQEEKEDDKFNWKLRAKIQDFSESVEDISFCPRVHGLKLASATLNGKVKIFEPTDYTNYRNWNCIVTKDVSVAGCSSLCWNPSLLDPQTLVVGCLLEGNKGNKGHLLQIFSFNEGKKEYSLIACLEGGHNNNITDVEWASQFGRSFHLIASTSLDMKLIIWKIDLGFEKKAQHFDDIKITYSILYEYKHNKPLWRLSWNISGSLVSVIDEDGKVLVFKKISKESFEKFDISE